jgi:hypothetical protein
MLSFILKPILAPVCLNLNSRVRIESYSTEHKARINYVKLGYYSNIVYTFPGSSISNYHNACITELLRSLKKDSNE